MALSWKDRIKVSVASGTTGTLTLGSADSGYQTFAAGDDAKVFPYVIVAGTAWETGDGTYTHSGTTFARTTFSASSTGSSIDATGGSVYVDMVAVVAQSLTDRWSLDATEVSITGAVTATVGKMHVCSGSSAYTVTLPAASGNAGKYIGFRITATNLVTLDGNASEQIDAALTRIMWKGESCILLCDGSNWFKIAGKSLPLIAAYSVTTTSVPTSTATKLTFNASSLDTSGLMVSSSRINIIRAAVYTFSTVQQVSNVANTTLTYYARIYKNGSNLVTTTGTAVSGEYPAIYDGGSDNFSINDYLEVYSQHYATSNEDVSGGLFVMEVPQW